MKINLKKMLLIVASMLAIAMFDNSKGVFMRSFIQFYHTDYQMLGVLLFFNSMAYMIGSVSGGYLVSATSKEVMMRLSALLAMIGTASIIWGKQLPFLFIGFIAIGAANAVVALIINTTIPYLKVKHPAWLMNFVHFLYGFGSTLTVIVTGHLLSIDWHFKTIYLFLLAIYIILLLVSLRVALPQSHNANMTKQKLSKRHMQLIMYFSLALGLYITAEIQTATWLVSYLMQDFKLIENQASVYMMMFFLTLSLGRLFGGLIAQRIGYLKAVGISIALALIAYVIGLQTGQQGANLIGLSGLFFAICFPTIVLSFKDYFDGVLNRASGIIFFLSAGINMFANPLLGKLAEQYSVRTAVQTIPFALLLSLLTLIFIMRKFPQPKETVTYDNHT